MAVLLLLLIPTFLVLTVNSNLIINIPELGRIEGNTSQTILGRTIYSFEGVPYAKPPIGRNRFKEAVSVEPWNGTLSANRIYRCIQYNQYHLPNEDFVIGDEDCLYANFYTTNTTAHFDVLVYIHGGSFMFNYGGLYKPDYLLDKNVVLVTINYRLGPLGFLSTEDDVVPGNNGLSDQIQALKFIKKTVQYFGGNPNSVTIFGNSAGGVSVHYHYLMPKSFGLFQQGFSMSGTALVPWALMEKSLEKTRTIADYLNCSTDSTQDMINCLRTKSAHQIVDSVKLFLPWFYNPFSPFGPVVNKKSVLPEHPLILLKSKRLYKVPWIASYTNAEGLFLVEDFYENGLENLYKQWYHVMPYVLDYNNTVKENQLNLVSLKIYQHYLKNETLSQGNFRKVVPMFSRRHFLNGIEKAVQLHANSSTAEVYSYRFDYRGKSSWFKFFDKFGKDFGAAHADDVGYILKLKALNTTSTVADQKMVKFMVNLLTSYAKNGKPEVFTNWTRVPTNFEHSKEFAILRIESADNVGMAVDDIDEFWDSLPIEENEKLIQTL